MSDLPLPSRPVNKLVIHHSASPRETTRQQLESWHKDRGFSQIGYHFVIGYDGVLEVGRELALAGAHARGYNQHSIGLCVTGNNTHPEQRWNELQTRGLADFVRWFKIFFPVAEVLGHRDLPKAATLCPGLDVRALLTTLGVLEG